jgi:2-polyprenyl-3-methyl-5-hydroxy-6-metoxy-1,4-benzoquinol methylase
MIACDLCGTADPRTVLVSPQLDGPLVQCRNCGLLYVGARRSQLTFGSGAGTASDVAGRVQEANFNIRNLRLEEEHRLALLNARWRLDLIRQFRTSGKLLEVGCARGDFLRVASESFSVFGVEPNPGLAVSAAEVAPIHQDVIETLPWRDFDVVSSFHVIEHVDSPQRFVAAMAERTKPGGLLVLETPDIHSLPFQMLKSRWRQFIPEHYFFFDRATINRLLSQSGFTVQRVVRIGKYASAALILNRLSRYFRFLRSVDDFAERCGISRLTVRINPLDIMIVFAVRTGDPEKP